MFSLLCKKYQLGIGRFLNVVFKNTGRRLCYQILVNHQGLVQFLSFMCDENMHWLHHDSIHDFKEDGIGGPRMKPVSARVHYGDYRVAVWRQLSMKRALDLQTNTPIVCNLISRVTSVRSTATLKAVYAELCQLGNLGWGFFNCQSS